MITSYLVSGAGNTFHIIKQSDIEFKNKIQDKLPKLAVNICKQYPADGLICLDINNDPKLKWLFYNNDGSKAEMCGNATRCVGFFLNQIIKSKNKSWQLETEAGLINISFISDHAYKVIMTAIKKLNSPLGFYCNTGVPHLVLPIKEFKNYSLEKESAEKLRNHNSFSTAGTNVTYVGQTELIHTIKAITYERGVEDFTLACGTGAVAAAFYQKSIHTELNEINVEMPGGKLKIVLNDINSPIMEGPAELVQVIQYA